MTTKDYM